MVIIDGAQGEGGGQILRSSLALSLVTGQPFRIERIRAGRRKPGLMRQHLTALNAAAEIGQADVKGAEIGSQFIEFAPQAVRGGRYRFSVGTAGSCTLVLQTVLPALLLAGEESQLELEGGTHNPFAPPFDFLEKAFLPLIERMGPRVAAALERPGFFPAGGGKFSVQVSPVEKLARIDLLDRGAIKHRSARALVSKISAAVGDRELKVVADKLGWPREDLCCVEMKNSRGPGNVLMLEIESDYVTEVFTGFGEKNVRAELVAEAAIEECKKYLLAGVPVGKRLADQLLIPMALAGGGAFRTLPLSRHTATNIQVIQQFLNVRIETKESAPGIWEIAIGEGEESEA